MKVKVGWINELFPYDNTPVAICRWGHCERDNGILWKGTSHELYDTEYINCTVEDISMNPKEEMFLISINSEEADMIRARQLIEDAVGNILQEMNTPHGEYPCEQGARLSDAIKNLAEVVSEIVSIDS